MPGVKHISINYEDFMVRPEVERYIPQGSEYEDAKTILKSGHPLLITGMKGIGKSLLAANIARDFKVPRFVFNCSQTVTEDDIIGYFIDLATFADGIVTQAVKASMDYPEGAMLVLEEVNALQPGVAMALHPLLDFNRMLIVKATGETYRVEGTRLFVVATANIGYEGTLPMNPAFKSRFVPLHLPNHTREVRTKIASKFVDSDVAGTLSSVVQGLQEAAKRGEIPDYPSTRELVIAAKLYNAFKDLKKAIIYAFIMPFLHSPTETELVKNVIASSSPTPLGL